MLMNTKTILKTIIVNFLLVFLFLLIVVLFLLYLNTIIGLAMGLMLASVVCGIILIEVYPIIFKDYIKKFWVNEERKCQEKEVEVSKQNQNISKK